jgi:large subunit ribosomal protein L9
MKIILLDDVQNLGKKYSILHVKNGYARNYLIPNKRAVLFSLGVSRHIEDLVKQKESKKKFLINKYQNTIDKIQQLNIKIPVKVTVSGKMYGSILSYDVSNLLSKHDIHIDKKNIIIIKPIKSIGKHKVRILFDELHSIETNFFIEIIKF